jgi:hypothetical protein
MGRIGFGSGSSPDGSDGFLGSGRVLPRTINDEKTQVVILRARSNSIVHDASITCSKGFGPN